MKSNRLAIYGAGGNGQKVYEALKKDDHNVVYFIDLYCSEDNYQGVPIYRPDKVPYQDELVLISVSCISESIKDYLAQFNIKNCLNMNEIIKVYPKVHDQFISQSYKAKLKKSVIDDKKQLQNFAKLLDKQSTECLNQIIKYRSNPSSYTYVENDWQLQYFPDWLLEANPWQKKEFRMIDCGAYTGDTLVAAKSALDRLDVKSQHFVCFEPDSKNYNSILSYLTTKVPNKNFTVQLYPCGVWNETSFLKFNAGDSQGKIERDSQNGEIIHVTSLDESCYGFAANFIKMDIEGAEPEALEGAKEIIRKFNPILAISVYHEPEHLWCIAQQILDINANYNFKLHTHGDFGLEIILYALPKVV